MKSLNNLNIINVNICVNIYIYINHCIIHNAITWSIIHLQLLPPPAGIIAGAARPLSMACDRGDQWSQAIEMGTWNIKNGRLNRSNMNKYHQMHLFHLFIPSHMSIPRVSAVGFITQLISKDHVLWIFLRTHPGWHGVPQLNDSMAWCCKIHCLKFNVERSFQWVDLRENLQETIDCPMKYGSVL